MIVTQVCTEKRTVSTNLWTSRVLSSMSRALVILCILKLVTLCARLPVTSWNLMLRWAYLFDGNNVLVYVHTSDTAQL